jgi:rubrerythrin
MPVPADTKVLFVCVQNAGRSQMAEALFARARSQPARARSAGLSPAGRVHHEAVSAQQFAATGSGRPLKAPVYRWDRMADMAIATSGRAERTHRAVADFLVPAPDARPLVARSPRRALVCADCGYGAVASSPPERCPMCGGGGAWRPAVRCSVRLVP